MGNGGKKLLGAGVGAGIGIGIVTDNLPAYGRRNDSTGLTGFETRRRGGWLSKIGMIEEVLRIAEEYWDDRGRAEDCEVLRDGGEEAEGIVGLAEDW